ncbi:hypothetical protein [Gloeothece verrucosa]|uniref:Uncharacterized protein n=1 Tax=Gloeothece verrucosa (strain PCC 7822) TaxID=497965 RepID=E0U8V7_GLOV7|nr:hypothetical protein [Gloeothece verrucosa]ADN14971.1 hypothetical protein Cyan7822_3016 [Gloeothece verrucosa PCC 7822]
MSLYFTAINNQDKLITKIFQKLEEENNIYIDKFVDTNGNIYYEVLDQEEVYFIDLVKHLEKMVEHFYQMPVLKIKASLKK